MWMLSGLQEEGGRGDPAGAGGRAGRWAEWPTQNLADWFSQHLAPGTLPEGCCWPLPIPELGSSGEGVPRVWLAQCAHCLAHSGMGRSLYPALGHITQSLILPPDSCWWEVLVLAPQRL